ncbi:uncharacterized protein LOC143868152 [Tasmannia lanceolata]|uniref:uncharacterized protein LOC143868152 n=1 Tax=Tasmannia lanceolata TaxID=3420 RepID=UPI0040638BAB
MQRHVKKPYETDLLAEWENEIQSPFVEVIARAQLIPNFDLPRLDLYDGTTDPLEYLQSYKRAIEFKGANDITMCHAFSSYLKRGANSWYSRLKPNSISSFRELGREFVTHFVNCRPQKKLADALLALRQGKEETLRSFICRFRTELSQIKDPKHEMVRGAMKSAVHHRDLKVALSIDPPLDLQELMAVADKYVNNEESFTMERELELVKAPEKRKEEARSNNGQAKLPRSDNRQSQSGNRAPSQQFKRYNYTPLNTSVANILYEIHGKENLQWPPKMKGTGRKRNTSKYCHFHGDHGHTTDDRYNLKSEIKKLVGLGCVDKYLLNLKNNGPSHKSEVPKMLGPSNPTQSTVGTEQTRQISEVRQPLDIRTNASLRIAGNIDVIAGGLASGGPTITGQKAYAAQIHAVEAPAKKLRLDSTDSEEQIVFTKKDYDDVHLPHDDAIVVRLIIANFNVSKVMIDTGNSVNILHYNAFKEMHLELYRLTPVEWSISRFFSGSIRIEGRIDLPVTFGTESHQKTIMQTFLVVKVPSTYNAIIGCPALNKLEAVVSTPHLKIKFLTKAGVGEVRGD